MTEEMIEMPNFRPQDALETVQEESLVYENTINDIFETYCPVNDTDC